MKKNIFYLLIIIFVFVACEGSNDNLMNSDPIIMEDDNNTGDNNNNNNNNNNNSEWLVPISEVKDGGPGKDGIPSIDSPKFVGINDSGAVFLDDDDLVIGILKGNEAKAYPHLILDWHEIVNDEINNQSITISYCPLTGTAFGWSSSVNGEISTFGVSGLLYNTNLILYDRSTDSNWSQLKLKCINGDLIGREPIVENVIETNWATWKTLFPNSEVLSLDTGFNRPYGEYPYGDYKTNHDFFIFTASPSNNALLNKERVYAIINDDNSKVYQFEKFSGGKVFKDIFNGVNYLVVGNENLIYSYELNEAQIDLNFEYDFNNSESFFKDDEGNKWSIFGKAIEGPRIGEQLKPSKSVVSFWFAIAAFYPNPMIYN